MGFLFQKGFLSHRTHYIVDFYLPKHRKLCLKIDGEHHTRQPQRGYDYRRDEFLRNTRGFRVIRIQNGVAERITPDGLLRLIDA